MMLAPFLLTMAIIPLKVAQLAAVGRPAPAEGFSMAPLHMANFRGIPVTDYLMSQFAVVITYLRLLLVPVGLNFDHDFPLRTEFLSAGVLLPLAVLIAIFSTGFWLLLKSRQNRACRLVSLGIFWFFITLSVESSIVPIEDLIFEHRVYLPSLGFFLAVTTGCAILLQRLGGKTVVVLRAAAVLAVTVILLGSALTVARNRLWQNEVAFWKDAAEKSPAKARPNRWYGAALLQREMAKQESDRDMGPACAILEKAVRLGPQDPQNHQVLAEVRVMQKNYGEALRSLAEVARLRPLSPKPHLARGEILEAEGDFAGACQAYLDAARVAPRWHVPHMKLAGLYLKQGNESLAVRSLEEALRIHPDETARKQLEELKGRSRSVGTL
jgi:cytochrome c-type biogenesis protein CcmH/NrfG